MNRSACRPSSARRSPARRRLLRPGKPFDDVKTVKKKAYVHLMPGIPNEAFFAGVVLILLLSFSLFERHGKPRQAGAQLLAPRADEVRPA